MSADPYEPVPTPWERHSGWLAPATVGLFTVVLLVVSFPPFHTPEFAYACMVPAVFWAYLRPRFKVYAWTLFVAQAIAWTINLSWLHPVTWVGLFILGPIVGAWTGTATWLSMPPLELSKDFSRSLDLGCGLWTRGEPCRSRGGS